jgi:hypothetical protein
MDSDSKPQGSGIKEKYPQGIVTARTCDCCGHHELGIVDSEGNYTALRPGMHVKVIENYTKTT